MADRFDVAGRLAEGQSAVDHTVTYVRACHLLDYQHPDLTQHDSQIRDSYDTEAGLDLRVLDGDSAVLRAAADAIDEALWLQRMQVTELGADWAGAGADAARQFVQRHCDAAAEVAAQVRAAAEGYAALRDDLWATVDRKVATAVAIDEGTAGQRSTWLAAAHEVIAGSPDRSTAEELIRQQVVPYVDKDIRGDWRSAMRSATASIEASYDNAVDALNSMRDVCFEIPGELGPRYQPVVDEPLTPSPAMAAPAPTWAAPAPTMPAAAPASVSAGPPPPAPPPPDPLVPLGDSSGLSSGASGLGGLGGLAGSIGGVVGSIVDSIGGLLSSLADGFSDSSRSAEPPSHDLLDDPFADDDTDDDTDDATADAEPADAQVDDDGDTDDEVASEEPAQNPPAPSEPVDEPVAQQVTSPPEALPPNEAAPPPAPPPDGSTPCEIAADELPQAGQ